MDLDQILADIAGEIDRKAVEIEKAADAREPEATLRPFGIAIAHKDGVVILAGAADRVLVQIAMRRCRISATWVL